MVRFWNDVFGEQLHRGVTIDLKPAEIAALSGVSADKQRQWRFREVVPFLDAHTDRFDSDIVHALQWKITADLVNRGLDVKSAAFFALGCNKSGKSVEDGVPIHRGQGLLEMSHAHYAQSPLFAFCRPGYTPESFANVSSVGGEFTLPLGDGFFKDFGFYYNLSSQVNEFEAQLTSIIFGRKSG